MPLLLLLLISHVLSATHPNYFNYNIELNGLVEDDWNQVVVSGFVANTQCSDRSSYSFMYHYNASDPDLIIFFQGGGACFSAVTCLVPGTFVEDLDELPGEVDKESAGFKSVEELRYRSILFVPYCTGDVHAGSSIRDMGFLDDIYHHGYYNAKAALDWMFSRWDNPRRLLVSGCSAGGYGAMMWLPYIESGMNAEEISHFSDSSVGVGPTIPLPYWGSVISSVNPYYSSLVPPNNHLPDLYQSMAMAYPDIQFSQFSHLDDTVQTAFSALTDGDFPNEVDTYMVAPTAPNYQFYASSGSKHCILQLDWSLYEVSGIAFKDWITNIALNEPSPNAAPWIAAPTKINLPETTIISTTSDIQESTVPQENTNDSLEPTELEDSIIDSDSLGDTKDHINSCIIILSSLLMISLSLL